MFIFKAGPRKVFRLKPVRCAKKVADPWFTQLLVKIDQNLNKLANISFPIFIYMTDALIFPRKFVTAKTNKL